MGVSGTNLCGCVYTDNTLFGLVVFVLWFHAGTKKEKLKMEKVLSARGQSQAIFCVPLVHVLCPSQEQSG